MRVATVVVLTLILAATAPAVHARAQNAADLRIYIVDVEGGGAALFVAPSGESLLIDTGNPDAQAPRDAARIMEVVKDAGLTQIDHLVTTHYHGDHIGGLFELAKRIPIRHFIDHGPNIQPDGSGARFLLAYEELHKQARHTIAKPGDTIAIPGLDIRVVASAGQVLQTPLPGAGAANPHCASTKRIAPDTTENGQSVALSIVFGAFRAVHLGDLTWNAELDLVCPANRLGTADLFVVSHHAQQRPAAMSNSEALVHALRPRVAISSNGIRKGAEVAAMKVLFSSPGLEDLWQLHFSQLSGQEYTVPGAFIANRFDEEETSLPVAAVVRDDVNVNLFRLPDGREAPPAPTHNGPARYFKVTAQRDGTFTVTNTRNGFSKTYRRSAASETN
jgi:beta-lactamase superfamily II metal-dependent hydrolase